MKKIRSILVANRSEIAIRIMRAAAELGMRTVAIYANEDRFALHRFKADESYLVGDGKKPIAAYLDIADIIRIAKQAKWTPFTPATASCRKTRISPRPVPRPTLFLSALGRRYRELGNKVAARALAEKVGVPVVPATGALPYDDEACRKLAAGIGYPIMLKAG